MAVRGTGRVAGLLVALSVSAVAPPGEAQFYWDSNGNTASGSDWIGTDNAASLVLRANGTTGLTIGYVSSGTPNVIGGYSGNGVVSGVVGASIGGGGAYMSANSVYDTYGVVGGGLSNAAGDGSGTVSDRPYATVSGGLGNYGSGAYSVIGGGRSNTADGSDAMVGGGRSNSTSSGNSYQTVAGGYSNSVTGNYGFVGGGYSNAAAGGAVVAGGYDGTASADYATVGGGYSNDATAQGATVSGGNNNTASGWYAVVAGGASNSATTDDYSAVGGGASNDATGFASVIPGGYDNTASGDYSFAAGRRARAYGAGCFAWADATNSDLECNVNNQAALRSSGGVVWYTNSTMTTGVTVNAGGGSWSSVSDVAAKRDIEPIDPAVVLALVGELPISTWRYEDEEASIRHMGPMAQDFRAAFGLGHSDRHITTIDAEGVALAAIQALRDENRRLRSELARLTTRVEQLERRVGPAFADRSLVPWFVLIALSGTSAGLWMGRRTKRGS